jgi:hypothetical protein
MHLHNGLDFLQVGIYSSLREHETEKFPVGTLKENFVGFNFKQYRLNFVIFLHVSQILFHPYTFH